MGTSGRPRKYRLHVLLLLLLLLKVVVPVLRQLLLDEVHQAVVQTFGLFLEGFGGQIR